MGSRRWLGRKNSGWRRGRCGYLYHGSEDRGVGLIASTGFPSQKSISRAVIAVRETRGRTVACAFSPFNFVCRPVAQFHSQTHTCIHIRLTVNRFVMNVGQKVGHNPHSVSLDTEKNSCSERLDGHCEQMSPTSRHVTPRSLLCSCVLALDKQVSDPRILSLLESNSRVSRKHFQTLLFHGRFRAGAT